MLACLQASCSLSSLATGLNCRYGRCTNRADTLCALLDALQILPRLGSSAWHSLATPKAMAGALLALHQALCQATHVTIHDSMHYKVAPMCPGLTATCPCSLHVCTDGLQSMALHAGKAQACLFNVRHLGTSGTAGKATPKIQVLPAHCSQSSIPPAQLPCAPGKLGAAATPSGTLVDMEAQLQVAHPAHPSQASALPLEVVLPCTVSAVQASLSACGVSLVAGLTSTPGAK